ncbi:U1 small nuclear ribonucleoprotein 70 kDa [Typha latifolia]|uniref:U1 small nuclear ribonucleoprotein 70 kDa n=1 Tax=Typha latifolia TaxID=4733 RepID=UPI003C2E5187
MGDFNNAMMRNADAAVQARTKAQNRANVLQLKLIGQSHPTGLTTNLLKLFEPRPPLEYKPPLEKRKMPAYTGMAQFVSKFAEAGDPEYAPPVQEVETREQKKARIRKLRLEKGAAKAAEDLQKYDPQNDPNVTGDPYKTLFVARLNYETSEHRIKREFEAYGPIKRVRLITDKVSNKPRGYAFIEYMHTRDMKTAYKQADGRKVDNKRVLVDVERGRTVPNWRPRRLGGGLGSSRIGGEEIDPKYSGREQQQIASGRPRSEEPRVRDDRHLDRDREKSRERGKDKDREREKSRERSHDRTRDRDTREERHHHRDRERNKERERERDRGRDRGRDKDRERDRGRESRNYDRDRERERDHDRHRDRDREREKDYERASHERDRSHMHEKDADYDIEPKHDRDLPGVKAREFDQVESDNGQEWNDGSKRGTHGHGLDSLGHESDRSKRHEHEYYDHEPYSKAGTLDYQNQLNRGGSEPREEGEAYDERDYEYYGADEYRK